MNHQHRPPDITVNQGDEEQHPSRSPSPSHPISQQDQPPDDYVYVPRSAHWNLDHTTTNPEHSEEWVGELVRRFSLPSPYTEISADSSASAGASMHLQTINLRTRFNSTESWASHVRDEQTLREHRYPLKSRGKEYAFLVVSDSRASTERDSPLFYYGEAITGRISMAIEQLSRIQRMGVILQEFEGDQTHLSFEQRRTMNPSDIDASLVKYGIVEWPFSLAPSHLPDSTASSNRLYRLHVTIYRRGSLTRNLILAQDIEYTDKPAAPTDVHSSPRRLRDSIGVPLPSISEHGSDGERLSPTSPVQARPWKEIGYEPFYIKGTLFNREVEYACVLIVPSSYPISPTVPLKLILTSSTVEAIDLVAGAPSSTLDIRLHKVVAFGADATRLKQKAMWQRDGWSRREHVGTASWHLVGPTTRLEEGKGYRVEFAGEIAVKGWTDLRPSVSFPDLIVMYAVAVYPVKAREFIPNAKPDTQLFIARIPLTRPEPVAASRAASIASSSHTGHS
ncbi:hypothetical protein K488DRAFT_86934 [Vararia minispora EC-137]|uniref:Uncharacterized protein n=1 Tax=Vararia minispora EC-137 TaxID=1314806 RepID=A0ACB8QIC8_9AGAM|nr:hypothetical protein K488DRAFT_86934 [Vararia minispora EC-137]